MKYDISFNDVLINPGFNTIASRADVNLDVSIAGLKLRLGIISSNMDTITEAKMAASMGRFGAVGALHRFSDIEANVGMYDEALDLQYNHPEFNSKYNIKPIVSIGVGSNEFERAIALEKAGAECILIDVAHGSSQVVVDQYDRLRAKFGDNVSIIVGNFANRKSIEDWLLAIKSRTKPDAFKIGIGGGSNCSTRVVSGCGRSTLSSLLDCSQLGIDLIADGGITSSGDIAKAYVAGAKAVMLGSLLAGTDETPGELFYKDSNRVLTEFEFFATNYTTGKLIKDEKSMKLLYSSAVKSYRGSASQESYVAQNKTADHRAPEGVTCLVQYKGPVKEVLQTLEAGVRSAFTYVGASNMEQFQNKAELIEVSQSTHVESTPHGLKG